MKCTHITTALAAALAAAAVAAPAQAAGWSCDASALRGSVLGGAAVEPVVANAGAETCRAATRSLDGVLPVPLGAGAVVASTAADRATVVAAGGLSHLQAGLLPALGLPVAQVDVPASLAALRIDLSGAGLPALPVLGGTPLPTEVTVDLRPAIAALAGTRALPAVELLELQGAMAYASGRCSAGLPVLDGSAQVAGLRVLGRALPTDRATTETISVLDGGLLDLARLDLSLVELPAALDTPQLRPLVEAALRPALERLEDLPVPAVLAEVRVRPGEQTREGGRLTQTALHVELDVLGRPVLDLDLGRATVGAADVACGVVEVLGSRTPDCTRRKVTLVDVLPRGGRVALVGAADRSLAGRPVDLVFEATGERVARSVVGPDGSFRASAPMPPAILRRSNAARYRAVVGAERSMGLKLERRMVVERVARRGGEVVIAGRVVGPLAVPVQPVVVQRRVTCSRWAVAGRVLPGRDGRFRVAVPAGTSDQAVLRLGTQVRKSTRNRKRFPTFTLPRAVDAS